MVSNMILGGKGGERRTADERTHPMLVEVSNLLRDTLK